MSSPPPQSPTEESASKSFSGRLKTLIKKYGWYALAVYLIIGTLDFGLVFVTINFFGADRVHEWTHAAREAVTGMLGKGTSPDAPGELEMDKISDSAAKGGSSGLYAMIVLAYGIHKTLLLPVRVGVTAAVTPRLVAWLGRRGWHGVAGTRRGLEEMKDRVRRSKVKEAED